MAAEVGVSPVYLTQVFRQVEGMPLYRYQLNLRLSRALDLLGEYSDLTMLALDLGFSSHSHFTFAFRKAYGAAPAEFSARRISRNNVTANAAAVARMSPSPLQANGDDHDEQDLCRLRI